MFDFFLIEGNVSMSNVKNLIHMELQLRTSKEK